MKIDDIQIQNLSFKYKDFDIIFKNININKKFINWNYWKNWLWKIHFNKDNSRITRTPLEKDTYNTNISENLRLWYKNLSYVPQKFICQMGR